MEKLPEDISPLQNLYLTAQGCVLLLVLKQHLKEMYGFTDSKIHRYSPNENSKMYDKPLNRKQTSIKFHPKQALDILKSGAPCTELDDEGKRQLVTDYLNFKQLMLSIDPDDDDEVDDAANKSAAAAKAGGAPATPSTSKEGQGQEDEAATPAATSGSTETSKEAQDKPGASPRQAPSIAPIKISALQNFTPSSGRHHRSSHSSHSSDRKRHRDKSGSSSRSHHKVHKHKKKKKKKARISDSEESEEGDDSDPDFVA